MLNFLSRFEEVSIYIDQHIDTHIYCTCVCVLGLYVCLLVCVSILPLTVCGRKCAILCVWVYHSRRIV